MNEMTNNINELRKVTRKITRELGILELCTSKLGKNPTYWHCLIEISECLFITIKRLCEILVLSRSSVSRVVDKLEKEGMVTLNIGEDKREKVVCITDKGKKELIEINDFANVRIKRGLECVDKIIHSAVVKFMEAFADGLETGRKKIDNIAIHTLSVSRVVRKQIIAMIEDIQKNEFGIKITEELNIGILYAEKEYSFGNSCNFWYAISDEGQIIGSIGLKKIDNENAEIKKFFVSAKFRGKGIADKLMGKLAKAAHKKHSFKYLYLGAGVTFQAAQAFCKKRGFTRITRDDLPKSFEICPFDSVFFKCNVIDLVKK